MALSFRRIEKRIGRGMAKYELTKDQVDAYYAEVRNMGLKPTSVPTVWQTLDEQEKFNVPDPTTKDNDERRKHLEVLRLLRGL